MKPRRAYADHTNADVQTITDPGELSDICTYEWNDLGAERKLVDQALLGQRSVTVLVLSPGRTFYLQADDDQDADRGERSGECATEERLADAKQDPGRDAKQDGHGVLPCGCCLVRRG